VIILILLTGNPSQEHPLCDFEPDARKAPH
jgi:hypothetical protein